MPTCHMVQRPEFTTVDDGPIATKGGSLYAGQHTVVSGVLVFVPY